MKQIDPRIKEGWCIIIEGNSEDKTSSDFFKTRDCPFYTYDMDKSGAIFFLASAF